MTTYFDLTPTEARILARRLHEWAEKVESSPQPSAYSYVRPVGDLATEIAFRIAKEHA